MDFKKILIAGVVIAGAWYLYNKSKTSKTTTSTDESASGINGAQYLYEEGAFQNAAGEFTQSGRCYCGTSNTPVAASSANDCQSKCGGQGRWIPSPKRGVASSRLASRR